MEELKIEHHHHFHFPSDPGQGKIIAALREVKELAMNMNDALAELTADDTELAADVAGLVNIINDIPARVQAAVAGALTDAGLADEHIRLALNNVDATVKDAITAAQSVLPPPPVAVAPVQAPPVAGSDTLTGEQGNDTIGGTIGNDTVAAAAPTSADTLAGGQAPDTVPGGAMPPATDASPAQTADPSTAGIVPPPSGS